MHSNIFSAGKMHSTTFDYRRRIRLLDHYINEHTTKTQFPDDNFFGATRRYSENLLAVPISLPKTGDVRIVSTAESQMTTLVREISTLFADSLGQNMNHGGMLQSEIAGVVEECLGLCEKEDGGSSFLKSTFSSLGLKVQVHAQQRLVKRACILRPNKREVVICIAISSAIAPKKNEAEGRILYCSWKWNTVRVGGMGFFWGCDLKLSGQGSLWDRMRFNCFRKGQGEGGDELKPLLLG